MYWPIIIQVKRKPTYPLLCHPGIIRSYFFLLCTVGHNNVIIVACCGAGVNTWRFMWVGIMIELTSAFPGDFSSHSSAPDPFFPQRGQMSPTIWKKLLVIPAPLPNLVHTNTNILFTIQQVTSSWIIRNWLFNSHPHRQESQLTKPGLNHCRKQ